jgi:hypothetical protein
MALIVGECLSGCASHRGADYIDEIIRARPFVCEQGPGLELCYYRGSEAERERRTLLEDRDRALRRVETFFGKRARGAVRVLVFPTYDDASPYPVGTASPELRAAYVAFQSGTWAYERHNAGHELTHVFSNTDSQWRTVYLVGLLDEGLAEYLGGFDLDPHLRLTQHIQAGGKATAEMRIESRNLQYKSVSLYPLAGSFVKFLVEEQPGGREKVLNLLERTRLPNRDAKPSFPVFVSALEATFEKPYSQLMAEWNRALLPYWQQSYPLRPEDRKRLEELLRPNAFKGVHYLSFPRFLHLVVTLDDDRRAVVEATSDDSWRIFDPDWRPQPPSAVR